MLKGVLININIKIGKQTLTYDKIKIEQINVKGSIN